MRVASSAGRVCRLQDGILSGAVIVVCRKGAAFGLAGIVKGLGVSAINGHGILDALKKALDDQGSVDAREGALFAFEALCEKLGRWAAAHLSPAWIPNTHAWITPKRSTAC